MITGTAMIRINGVMLLRSSPAVGFSSQQRALARRSSLSISISNSSPWTADFTREFSSKKKGGFRPRRQTPSHYRPVQPYGDRQANRKGNKGFQMGQTRYKKAKDTLVELKGIDTTTTEASNFQEDPLIQEFGPEAAHAMRKLYRDEQEHLRGQSRTVEDHLRMMDYMTAAEGSTEDLVGQRRALALDSDSQQEMEETLPKLEALIEEERINSLHMQLDMKERERYGMTDAELNKADEKDLQKEGADITQSDDPMQRTTINPNQLAFGEWGETIVRVDRVMHLWRGGRLESYRALVIGGNLNGCAGFGVGKGADEEEAILTASRKCKRNIFFVDRYQGNALTRDLVGKQNSCRVILLASDRGLRGNPLACDILAYFGITNATAKCVHGNRSQLNVVLATFKALATHESMEEIALKRGKRITSLDRARRMQV